MQRFVKWLRAHRLITVAAVFAIAIWAFVIVAFSSGFARPVGLPHGVATSLSFPVYFPRHAPAGLTFQPGSVSTSAGVLTFAYTYEGGKTLAVTEQSTGGGFDPSTFNPTTDFTTTIGHAYLVDLEDRTTAAVVTDKSLLLINAPQKMAVDTLTDFVNSLRPAR